MERWALVKSIFVLTVRWWRALTGRKLLAIFAFGSCTSPCISCRRAYSCGGKTKDVRTLTRMLEEVRGMSEVQEMKREGDRDLEGRGKGKRLGGHGRELGDTVRGRETSGLSGKGE